MFLKSLLCKNFETKALGIADYYLGIKTVGDNFKIELGQKKNVLERFVMNECKPTSRSIDKNINVTDFT